MRIGRLVLVALAVAPWVSSCGNDEEGPLPSSGGQGGDTSAGGASEGGGGGSASCSGPAWPNNPACEACQNEHCCLTGANCVGDPDCVASMECEAAGSSDCTAGHASGIWNYSGILVCLQNHCASECLLPEAVCGSIIPTPASCTDEIQAACCDETAACGQSDACVAFIYQCIDENECTTQACIDDCRAQYPDADAPFTTMYECWSGVGCL